MAVTKITPQAPSSRRGPAGAGGPTATTKALPLRPKSYDL
jgi:hypothetical protein